MLFVCDTLWFKFMKRQQLWEVAIQNYCLWKKQRHNKLWLRRRWRSSVCKCTHPPASSNRSDSGSNLLLKDMVCSPAAELGSPIRGRRSACSSVRSRAMMRWPHSSAVNRISPQNSINMNIAAHLLWFIHRFSAELKNRNVTHDQLLLCRKTTMTHFQTWSDFIDKQYDDCDSQRTVKTQIP